MRLPPTSIGVLCLIVLTAVSSSALASPYGDPIMSFPLGGHYWGLWQRVDVPTGNAAAPFRSDLYLELGPMGRFQLGSTRDPVGPPVRTGIRWLFALAGALVVVLLGRRLWARRRSRSATPTVNSGSP